MDDANDDGEMYENHPMSTYTLTKSLSKFRGNMESTLCQSFVFELVK